MNYITLSDYYMQYYIKSDMEAVFEKVCKVIGFQGLNKFQIEAITHTVLEKGIDIFVNLPTGG